MKVQCPQCGKYGTIPDKYATSAKLRIKCPNCTTYFTPKGDVGLSDTIKMQAATELSCHFCGTSITPNVSFPFGSHQICIKCKPDFIIALEQDFPLPGEVSIATFKERVAAKFIDLLIIFALSISLLNFQLLPFEQSMVKSHEFTDTLIPYTLLLIMFWGLFIVYNMFMGTFFQDSLGKKIINIKSVDDSFHNLPTLRRILRAFSELFSVVGLLAGYILALFHPRQKTLHDIISRSVVVRI